ncbi:hypothetical protein DIU36_05030 [Mucilaginibacter rubeus]|nr:hypothetical protein DIU36_05030 [Mucilaginibacter rubeus]
MPPHFLRTECRPSLNYKNQISRHPKKMLNQTCIQLGCGYGIILLYVILLPLIEKVRETFK